MDNHSSIVPRNGHTLVVGVVARISGCENQTELSLEDQEEHAHQVVAEYRYDAEVEYRVIATVGKGERLDRPELAQVEAVLRSRELDLLVCEDIGPLVRGAEAVRLCGAAVDHGVRVIAPNDCIDTADPDWEEEVLDACKEHVGHNAHTSKRLKQKLMRRLVGLDAATPLPTYGYVKPDEAETYDDWTKDPKANRLAAGSARLVAHRASRGQRSSRCPAGRSSTWASAGTPARARGRSACSAGCGTGYGPATCGGGTA